MTCNVFVTSICCSIRFQHEATAKRDPSKMYRRSENYQRPTRADMTVKYSICVESKAVRDFSMVFDFSDSAFFKNMRDLNRETAKP